MHSLIIPISAPGAWFVSPSDASMRRRCPDALSILLRRRCLKLGSLNSVTVPLFRRSRTWMTDVTGRPSSLVSRYFFARSCASSSAIDFVGLGGSVVLRDTGATLLVMAGAYGLVSAFDILSQHNVIQQSLSRKLVHILSGLVFMGAWPLFSTSTEARYFAAIVPLANCLRLLVYGLSQGADQALIKSLTRDGNPEELLRGPFYYVLVLILCTVVFWRESPVGVISMAMMCGGDGVADIIGRRFGSVKIPYNQNKSWVGSVSMFSFGFLISLGMLYYFSALGYFQLDWFATMKKVAFVSLVATAIESLPAELIDDNISVPLATMAIGYMIF